MTTSSTSFYCREAHLFASFTDLGEPALGAVINIYANADRLASSCCAFFFDDVEYARRLCALINDADLVAAAEAAEAA